MRAHVQGQCRGILQANKPTVVLGLSPGGMVAMNYLIEDPSLFSAYILINSSVASLSPVTERMRFAAIPSMLRALLTQNFEKRESLILDLVSNTHAEDPQVLRTFARIQRESPVSFSTALRQLYAVASFRPKLSEIVCPGLVLCSARDRLVSPEASRKIAKYLGAPCYEHPTAGHDLPLDDASWVLTRIRNFLS